MVRSMMRYCDLPYSYWRYALETSNYTWNLVSFEISSFETHGTVDWTET